MIRLFGIAAREGACTRLAGCNVSLRSRLHFIPGQRYLHVTVSRFSGSSTVDIVSDVFETSSRAKWAADAAQMADLSPQGDLISIGLGGYSPVGMLQTGIEWLHIHTGLPWWCSIILSTIILRSLLFPLAIKLQVNAATINNIRPQTDRIMEKMKEFQQTGNTTMAAQESARLMLLYNKHKCNPLKMMIMPFVQVS